MKYKAKKNLIEVKNENSSLFIEVINKGLLRIYKKKNNTDLIELNDSPRRALFKVEETNDFIEFNIGDYKLIIDKELNFKLFKKEKYLTTFNFNHPFDDVEKRLYYQVNIKIYDKKDYVFGLGDKMSYLDKKGYFFASYNTDDPSHQDELFPSLYKSINYLLFSIDKSFFGLYFPSTYRYTYDIAKTNLDTVKVNNFNAQQDFFLILGKDVKEVTQNYSDLVGHPYMVRMKMLGYSQCRWSYENEEMVKDVFNKFKEYKLPLDYIHLDIHYMDGYRDFTIDKTRFKDMKKLTDTLKKEDVEVIAINDAAIKLDTNFDLYNMLEKNGLFSKLNDKTYINTVWPGESAFPNYADPKCQKLISEYAYKFIKENGISGLWCDMNEPASFNGPLPKDVDHSFNSRKLDHEEEHNVYGEHMVKSFVNLFTKDNVRSYIFTRAGLSTTPKYAFAWNGDNFSLWHHLRYSLTQNLSQSISNFMFNGVDIGGFGGDTTKELLIRWIEANLFMPFIRNHSSLNTKNQEPYAFDEEALNIYKKFLDVRYKFIPYLYNLVYEMNKKGSPIIRPMFYNYEDDDIAYTINDQYMVGEDLLIAPILNKDERFRQVYLPKGEWVNYFTNEKIKGGKFVVLHENLAESGYFIRNNTIIPMFENLLHIEKEKIDTLVLHIYGKKGKVKIYEDDGKSMDYLKDIYNIYEAKFDNEVLNFKFIYQNYHSPFKTLKVIYENRTYTFEFKEYTNLSIRGDNL